MKKLFGRDKPKPAKSVSGPKDIAASGGVPTALPEDGSFYAQQYNTLERHSIRASSDEHWDIVSHDNTSPILNNYAPRSVSPFSAPPAVPPKSTGTERRDRDTQILRKKPPSVPNPAAAVGILRSLDPLAPDTHPLQREYSDDYSNSNELSSREEGRDSRREKKGFWERAKERDREREKEKERHREKERREEEVQAELTRMIGYLTASASEDWSLVLELCERASASEANAKEAVKALRKEFKYAEPTAQLSAARLWAIMLRNCSELFVTQCTSRKFLDTLEDVLRDSRTSPVVRERLLDVLAGAAYMNPPPLPSDLHLLGVRHDSHGFRALWRKVKPPEKPDEGTPFDTEDAMFNPPTLVVQHSETHVKHSPPLQHQNSTPQRPPTKHKSSSRNRIIPPEEDIRRLFQECNIGSGNANLLSDALTYAKPEDLKSVTVIREFYARCRASQELIYAAIPWASAGAERSRQAAALRNNGQEKRLRSGGDPHQQQLHPPAKKPEEKSELTVEEQLLAALLDANEELTAALRQYEDLERVGIERDTEERSKKETRIDRNRLYYDQEGSVHLELPQPIYGGSSHTPSPSSSPSPSPAPSVKVTPSTQQPPMPLQQSATSANHGSQHSIPSLAPPPPPPHGPRLPSSIANRSRTPSPERYSILQAQVYGDHQHDALTQGLRSLKVNDETLSVYSDEEYQMPVQPSAKALGKRRAMPVDEDSAFDPNDLFYEHANESRRSDDFSDDSDDIMQRSWHQPVHYVYDAAAERTKERLREGLLASVVVNEVH